MIKYLLPLSATLLLVGCGPTPPRRDDDAKRSTVNCFNNPYHWMCNGAGPVIVHQHTTYQSRPNKPGSTYGRSTYSPSAYSYRSYSYRSGRR